MKNVPTRKPDSSRSRYETRPEYDFSGGVRGKYVDRYRKGTNVVLLDPEVAAAFPDSTSVNDALRALLAIAKRTETRKRT
jgi:hypothetical protein